MKIDPLADKMCIKIQERRKSDTLSMLVSQYKIDGFHFSFLSFRKEEYD